MTSWKIYTLGELCESVSSGNCKNRNEEGIFPIFGSTGVIGYSCTYSHNTPTILVARVGANAGMINKGVGKYNVSDNTLIICNDESVYNYEFAYYQLLNYNINRLRIWASDCSVIKEIDATSSILFLYNLLLYKQDYIYFLQVGGAQPHVFPKDIERIKLFCPPLPEQKAIAEVLTTADDEIATHRKKLDALRLQKRGLMQQLLTGKTRVKIYKL